MGLIILILFYGPVMAAFAPDIPPGITVEESLKDESLVNLAYSNPLYNNVGLLCCKDDPKPVGFGSAVYIGGKTCLTAAHCYMGQYYQYQVGFEIPFQGMQYYDVVAFLVHPNYENNITWDIGVLILATEIEELEGLKPNYDALARYARYKEGTQRVTYLGYGMKITQWFQVPDDHRRAEQTYLWKHTISELKSAPCGYFNPVTMEEHESTLKPRPIMMYEARKRFGMSGGAVLHDEYGLVGIMTSFQSCTWQNLGTYIVYKIFINLFDALIYPFHIFSKRSFLVHCAPLNYGSSARHFPLSDGKEWIEDVRLRYDVNGEEVKMEPLSFWQTQRYRAYYICLTGINMFVLYKWTWIAIYGIQYLMKDN